MMSPRMALLSLTVLAVALALSQAASISTVPLPSPSADSVEPSIMKIIMESKLTGKYVRPSADRESFNGMGRKCNKRSAFEVASYLRDGLAVHTLRNVKIKKLIVARDESTLSAMDLSNEMVAQDHTDLSAFFIFHVAAHGMRIESLKYRGQYLTVTAGGDVILQAGDYGMKPSHILHVFFLVSHYHRCEQLQNERRMREKATMTTQAMMALATEAPTIGRHEANELASILSQAGAKTARPNTDIIRNHVRVTTPAPATEAPTVPEETPSPTYVPLSDGEQIDLLDVLRAAGLDLN